MRTSPTNMKTARFDAIAPRVRRVTGCLFTAALLLFASTTARAQQIIYSPPVRSSSAPIHHPSYSHPSASYPAVAPSHTGTVVPYQETIISERVISSTPSEPTQIAATKPKASHRESELSRPSLESPGVTRLASTNRFRTITPLPRRDRYYSAADNIEIESTYRTSMIDSARQSALQFRSIAESTVPMVSELALQNAKLADQWADVAQTYNVLFERTKETQTKLDATTQDYEDVRLKLENYGLTPTIGLLLRHKKEQLDAWQVQDSQAVLTSEQIQRLRQQQLQLEMIRYDGSDAFGETAEILALEGYDASNKENAHLASQVQRLLRERHQWIASLTRVYQDYRSKLGEMDSATTDSLKLTDDYRVLINRHITWIRSGEPVNLGDLSNLKGGLAALFNPGRSQDFGPTLQRKLDVNPVGGIRLLMSIVLLLILRWRTKVWLIGIGSRKRLRETSADIRKCWSAVLSILVALTLPGILYMIARWFGDGIVSESTLHASAGFYAASLVALTHEIPRQLLRPYGYLDKHVDVDMPRRERAGKYLSLMGLGMVVMSYAVTVMGAIDHGMWRGSVGRFGFMAAMILVAWTAHLAFRPSGGWMVPLIAKYGGSVVHRVRFMIYLAAIAFPLFAMSLAALGYGFTANELIKRGMITLCGVMAAVPLWTSLKILSARAWERLTGVERQERQFDEYGEIETPATEISGTLAEHSLELKHHLAFLSQCALLLGAILCFGWLWIDVFPNIRTGNPVVWTVEESVTKSSYDDAGYAITDSVVQTKPITALHLILAAATLFVAFQLAKLLPAIFDALVLQRVSFDEGMEHFTFVLGRFLLFGTGCLIACKLLEVRWQTIQWLAVGLTIGLGFGLQDMVRNLFGGFVVLFEKPARLGDLVTVGRITGRIASQKFRTTVLSDDEGREVIVPNKKFVSEDIVNWRGAGRLYVIPIAVAVKRDKRPADVCRMLQELVVNQEDVLLTPAPQATLVCVGKRSQRIEVRAWIEEGKDATRHRDTLLKTVRSFLKEENLLAADQPSQPSIGERAGGPFSGRKSAA